MIWLTSKWAPNASPIAAPKKVAIAFDYYELFKEA